MVSEPSSETAVEMVTALRDKYEAFHRVKIPDSVIETAVKLSQRYISDRFLPDKAVDLIDEAAAAVRLPAISLPEEIKSAEKKLKKQNHEVEEADKIGDTVRVESLKKEIEENQLILEKLKEQYQTKKSTTTNSVDPETIAEIVSRWTNIPVSRLTESEAVKLLDLEKIIHKRLINQEEAVSAVSEAVRRGRAGLKSNKRPIGSFIFMGPTGVGKTELAKSLAEILFGSEEMMIRLDMTEYMEKHEVAKLIGAPPGYVGYEEGGQLTEAVRRMPYAVVLLDEIEKAHPDVFNILIQLLDDGRLTDNKGRTISFKNTIVICTSNLGSGIIQEEMMNWGIKEVREIKIPAAPLKIFATYSVSPTGRNIITLEGHVWKKDPSDDLWHKDILKNYFAGSIVTGMTLKEGEKLFPEEGLDTHLISPDGSETITLNDKVWFRTSTTSKEWRLSSILDTYKDHVVINALPDKPEQQLPTARFDTHAVSVQNREVITYADRFWARDNRQVKDWSTGKLSDFFADASLSEEAEKPNENLQDKKQPDIKPDKSDSTAHLIQKRDRKAPVEFPVKGWDVHLYKPAGEEIIIAGNRYYLKKDPNLNSWITGLLEKLFTTIEVARESASVKPADKAKVVPAASVQPADKPESAPDENEVKEESFVIPVKTEVEEKVKEENQEDNRFEQLADRLMEELRKFFRPELLNRYDEVVVFRPLTRNHMLEIVSLQLEILRKTLQEQNIAVTVTPYAQAYLTEIGFDPIFGARPLRRTIQREIENPISSSLIKGDLVSGDTYEIDYDGSRLTFNIKKMQHKKTDDKSVQTPAAPVPSSAKAGQPEVDIYLCGSCANKFEALLGTQNVACPRCQSTSLTLLPPPSSAASAQPASGLAQNQSQVQPGFTQVQPEIAPSRPGISPAPSGQFIQPGPSAPPSLTSSSGTQAAPASNNPSAAPPVQNPPSPIASPPPASYQNPLESFFASGTQQVSTPDNTSPATSQPSQSG